MSSLHSGTSNPVSQLNSEIASWDTKRKDNHSSTSIFDENIGEGGLSSQSAYNFNINNPCHNDSIATNCQLLQDSLSLTDDELKDAYVGPRIGMNPKPVWGCPQFGMSTKPNPNRFGDPCSNMGSPF